MSIINSKIATLDTVIVDGESRKSQKSGEYYMVSFPGIFASQLANSHTINAGDCEITISAMSYVYEMIIRDSSQADMKDMLCALYEYAQACK